MLIVALDAVNAEVSGVVEESASSSPTIVLPFSNWLNSIGC
jgi:hypothetical protein